MTSFDGTAARQLDLIEDYRPAVPVRKVRRDAPMPPRGFRDLRLLKQDVYAAIERRRRRAQIAARRALTRPE
jgi:hypothetical protein